MKKYQNGFLGELTLAGWVVALFIVLFIGSMIMSIAKPVYDESSANIEQLKQVNALVKLAQNQPFAEEFNNEIKPYLKDGVITKLEASKILEKYEIMKLKYETSK